MRESSEILRELSQEKSRNDSYDVNQDGNMTDNYFLTQPSFQLNQFPLASELNNQYSDARLGQISQTYQNTETLSFRDAIQNDLSNFPDETAYSKSLIVTRDLGNDSQHIQLSYKPILKAETNVPNSSITQSDSHVVSDRPISLEPLPHYGTRPLFIQNDSGEIIEGGTKVSLEADRKLRHESPGRTSSPLEAPVPDWKPVTFASAGTTKPSILEAHVQTTNFTANRPGSPSRTAVSSDITFSIYSGNLTDGRSSKPASTPSDATIYYTNTLPNSSIPLATPASDPRTALRNSALPTGPPVPTFAPTSDVTSPHSQVLQRARQALMSAQLELEALTSTRLSPIRTPEKYPSHPRDPPELSSYSIQEHRESSRLLLPLTLQKTRDDIVSSANHTATSTTVGLPSFMPLSSLGAPSSTASRSPIGTMTLRPSVHTSVDASVVYTERERLEAVRKGVLDIARKQCKRKGAHRLLTDGEYVFSDLLKSICSFRMDVYINSKEENTFTNISLIRTLRRVLPSYIEMSRLPSVRMSSLSLDASSSSLYEDPYIDMDVDVDEVVDGFLRTLVPFHSRVSTRLPGLLVCVQLDFTRSLPKLADCLTELQGAVQDVVGRICSSDEKSDDSRTVVSQQTGPKTALLTALLSRVQSLMGTFRKAVTGGSADGIVGTAGRYALLQRIAEDVISEEESPSTAFAPSSTGTFGDAAYWIDYAIRSLRQEVPTLPLSGWRASTDDAGKGLFAGDWDPSLFSNTKKIRQLTSLNLKRILRVSLAIEETIGELCEAWLDAYHSVGRQRKVLLNPVNKRPGSDTLGYLAKLKNENRFGVLQASSVANMNSVMAQSKVLSDQRVYTPFGPADVIRLHEVGSDVVYEVLPDIWCSISGHERFTRDHSNGDYPSSDIGIMPLLQMEIQFLVRDNSDAVPVKDGSYFELDELGDELFLRGFGQWYLNNHKLLTILKCSRGHIVSLISKLCRVIELDVDVEVSLPPRSLRDDAGDVNDWRFEKLSDPHCEDTEWSNEDKEGSFDISVVLKALINLQTVLLKAKQRDGRKGELRRRMDRLSTKKSVPVVPTSASMSSNGSNDTGQILSKTSAIPENSTTYTPPSQVNDPRPTHGIDLSQSQNYIDSIYQENDVSAKSVIAENIVVDQMLPSELPKTFKANLRKDLNQNPESLQSTNGILDVDTAVVVERRTGERGSELGSDHKDSPYWKASSDWITKSQLDPERVDEEREERSVSVMASVSWWEQGLSEESLRLLTSSDSHLSDVVRPDATNISAYEHKQEGFEDQNTSIPISTSEEEDMKDMDQSLFEEVDVMQYRDHAQALLIGLRSICSHLEDITPPPFPDSNALDWTDTKNQDSPSKDLLPDKRDRQESEVSEIRTYPRSNSSSVDGDLRDDYYEQTPQQQYGSVESFQIDSQNFNPPRNPQRRVFLDPQVRAAAEADLALLKSMWESKNKKNSKGSERIEMIRNFDTPTEIQQEASIDVASPSLSTDNGIHNKDDIPAVPLLKGDRVTVPDEALKMRAVAEADLAHLKRLWEQKHTKNHPSSYKEKSDMGPVPKKSVSDIDQITTEVHIDNSSAPSYIPSSTYFSASVETSNPSPLILSHKPPSGKVRPELEAAAAADIALLRSKWEAKKYKNSS